MVPPFPGTIQKQLVNQKGFRPKPLQAFAAFIIDAAN
jgi:hypothetical protein